MLKKIKATSKTMPRLSQKFSRKLEGTSLFVKTYGSSSLEILLVTLEGKSGVSPSEMKLEPHEVRASSRFSA